MLNSDLIKVITDAMKESALGILARKLPGAVGPLEREALAAEIAKNCAHAVTMFIDNHTEEIERAYVAEHTLAGALLDSVGIDSTDSDGESIALIDRMKILAVRNRSEHNRACIAELASLAHRGWENINTAYVKRVNEIRAEYGLPVVP